MDTQTFILLIIVLIGSFSCSTVGMYGQGFDCDVTVQVKPYNDRGVLN